MNYVTSDLHGYPLADFLRLLDKARFSDADDLIILGDVIDRNGDGGVEIHLPAADMHDCRSKGCGKEIQQVDPLGSALPEPRRCCQPDDEQAAAAQAHAREDPAQQSRQDA